jgi:ArsR family transcriptional regulator
MREAEKFARVFKVLSVGTRVRMIQLLKSRALCVNALARELAISPAAVSQHLRILRDADIVTSEKRGYFVHYRVNEKTLAKWEKMSNDLLGIDTE